MQASHASDTPTEKMRWIRQVCQAKKSTPLHTLLDRFLFFVAERPNPPQAALLSGNAERYRDKRGSESSIGLFDDERGSPLFVIK